MKKAIQVNGLSALGPYSIAIEKSNSLYLSGQIAFDFESDTMVGKSASEQAEVVMTNISRILEKARFTFEDVVKTTIFLIDMNDFAEVNKVYSGFLKAPFPARSTIGVNALPKGALVEIEMIACK